MPLVYSSSLDVRTNEGASGNWVIVIDMTAAFHCPPTCVERFALGQIDRLSRSGLYPFAGQKRGGRVGLIYPTKEKSNAHPAARDCTRN
jgi:hypothetical protein